MASESLYRRVNRRLLPFLGPAALGAGHPEDAYRPVADPACPVCGKPLAAHEIERREDSGRSTSLHCPS